MRCLRFITIVWLLLSTAACSPATPQLPVLSTEASILAFGDSLTYGTGAPASQSYPAVLERLTGRMVINAGVPGEVTVRGRERLPELLDRHQPQLLLLLHGGNDLLRRAGEHQTAENIRAMIRVARDRGVAVILIGVPKPGLRITVPSFYARIAEEFSLPYAAAIVADIEGDPALKSDPIHPNAEGYRRLAEGIFELMRAAGAV